MLSRFHTPYCTNLLQDSNRPKQGDAHDNAQIPNLQFSLPTFVPENCRPVTLQLCVAIAKFRKTCLSQIVLLQYKAKPYLRFQNLGCHCKILWCSFDTQKRLKKHCHWAQVIIQTHKQGCQVVMKNRATITIKARKYQKIQKKDKYTKTLLQSIHIQNKAEATPGQPHHLGSSCDLQVYYRSFQTIRHT